MSGEAGALGRTILLVDDSPKIRPLIREILSNLNYRILEANSAEQAMEVAAAHGAPVDLLLTDVNMPGMNGFELAKELRLRYSDIEVLCMSGYMLPSTSVKGMHFIEKPFRPDSLIQAIEQIFGNGSQSSALPPA